MPRTSTAFGKRTSAFDYDTTSSLRSYGGSFVSATEYPTVNASTVIGTAPNATINFDVDQQSVLFFTQNAGGNWTINFRGSAGTSFNSYIGINETITVVMMTTQGATAYYNNAYQIDGTTVVPKWQGGTAPTAGNASGLDIYTYTITKTANATYTVLAAITQFK
jgi:hypothetical protein